VELEEVDSMGLPLLELVRSAAPIISELLCQQHKSLNHLLKRLQNTCSTQTMMPHMNDNEKETSADHHCVDIDHNIHDEVAMDHTDNCRSL
jgi:hypothetical protein